MTATANPGSLDLTQLRILSLLFGGFPFPPKPDILPIFLQVSIFQIPIITLGWGEVLQE